MIKTSIVDGMGSKKEACVKNISESENALCVSISSTTSQVVFQTSPFVGGGQVNLDLTEDGLGINNNAAVNGSTNNVKFIVNPDVVFDTVIEYVQILGLDNSIKLNNWMGLNNSLSNGCLLNVKANNLSSQFGPFSSTLDLAAFSGKGGFDLYSEAAGDMVRSIREFKPLFVLRKKGTFGTTAGMDDYIEWVVQDNVSSVNEIRISIRGFLVESGKL